MPGEGVVFCTLEMEIGVVVGAFVACVGFAAEFDHCLIAFDFDVLSVVEDLAVDAEIAVAGYAEIADVVWESVAVDDSAVLADSVAAEIDLSECVAAVDTVVVVDILVVTGMKIFQKLLKIQTCKF